MPEPNTATLEEAKAAFDAALEKGLAKNSEELKALAKQNAEASDKRLAEFDARLQQLAETSRTFSVPGSAEAKHKGEKYSFAKAMNAVVRRDFSLAPMEFEMHKQIEKQMGQGKAMSFGNDSAGGFLVPNEVAVAELIPLLYAQSVAVALGARQLSGLNKAPFEIPKVSGGTTSYWVGEAATITASDMATQMLSLQPKGLAAVTVISDLLQVLDSAGVEQMIREDMAQQLALKLDLGVLAGTGGSGQPIGILNASGVNTATLTDPTTYDELLTFVSEVRGDNALMGKPGWAVSNADMLELEQMKDVTGGTDNKANIQPLGSRSLLTGAWPNQQLLNYPVKVSTQLADGQVIFGNWADVIIAQWGGMRFDLTNALGFLTAQTHLRTLTYVDVGIRHAQSFCIPA